ncbi:amidohydrolase family protein [Mycoplasmatota bacterium WC30]
MKALINARIYDYHNYQENVYIIFDEKIREIGKMSKFKAEKCDEIIDLKNNMVLPGFVCSHTHLYSAFARGMSVPFNPKSFRDVLEQLWWKLDHFLDERMTYLSAFSFGLEQLKKGSTTLIDHHASGHILGSLNQIKKALINDLGMRAILAFETSDRFNIEEALKENVNFIENNKSEVCSGLFGLHASFTLSDDTLKKVSERLNNAGIHIHVAESIKDEEDSMKKYNKTVVERLNDFGLINKNSILVHCANVSEKELDIIKAKEATIAINVTSNMNNAVGLPNIRLMEDKGIKLMIGNDGLIQSMPLEYLNAYYTAHLQTKNPVGFSIDGIKKAIINSYDYVNSQLKTKIGKIEEGYDADLISVSYQEFTPLNKDNIFGHLFFGMFPSLNPEYVIASGKLVVRNYKAPIELENKNLEAKQEAAKLWKIIDEEGKNLKYKI